MAGVEHVDIYRRVSLDHDEVAQIEQLITRGAARGDRYPTPRMAILDSER